MADLGSDGDDREDHGDDDGREDGDGDYGEDNGSPPGFSAPVDCSSLCFLSRFSQSQPGIEVFNQMLERNDEPLTG